MMRSFCKEIPKRSYTPKDTTRFFGGQITSIAVQLFYVPLVSRVLASALAAQ